MKKVLLTSVVLAVVLVGWILSGNNKNVLPTPLVSPESTASPPPRT